MCGEYMCSVTTHRSICSVLSTNSEWLKTALHYGMCGEYNMCFITSYMFHVLCFPGQTLGHWKLWSLMRNVWWEQTVFCDCVQVHLHCSSVQPLGDRKLCCVVLRNVWWVQCVFCDYVQVHLQCPPVQPLGARKLCSAALQHVCWVQTVFFH